MENRAAVFTSQPQAVEVHQAGTWWAGELLGWRHDTTGSCQVWVRVVLGGVEETAWTDLASVRLPERHLAVAGEAPSSATLRRSMYAPRTQEMSVARHPAGRRVRCAETDDAATASLPPVRDLSVVPDLPVAGGRRSAAETAQFASVGRRRAPETEESSAVGRRRAPETSESPAVGRRRAPETGESAVVGRHSVADVAVAAGRPPVPPGRHRAPADPGRHRTADTGMVPVVPSEREETGSPAAGAATRPRVPAARAPRGSASGADWTAPEDIQPELLTRPMRLTDHVPHARRPRVDGSLRKV